MNLNGMSGDYYDYLKASSSSIIVGATWNKIVHDGVYVGVSQALSAGSVDYSAASTLSRSKAAAGFELVLYTKTGMETVNRLIILGYKSFLILSRECLGIIM
jgi:molybdopterin-containing oxidoreductase family iron-sulfur binding subunit